MMKKIIIGVVAVAVVISVVYYIMNRPEPGESGKKTGPFSKAVVQYISEQKLDMMVVKFENLDDKGSTATADVILRKRSGDKKEVTKHFEFKKTGRGATAAWKVTKMTDG